MSDSQTAARRPSRSRLPQHKKVKEKSGTCEKPQASKKKVEEKYELKDGNGPTLTVQGVASRLFCTVDTVRKIPSSELPYSKPGKRNVYLLEDVLDYLRKRRNFNPQGQKNLRRRKRQIDSMADNVRGRS